MLEVILREIVDVNDASAPPQAQAEQDAVRANLLSMGREINGYSVRVLDFGKEVTVHFA